MTRSKQIAFLFATVLVMLLAFTGKRLTAGRVLTLDGGPSGGVYTVFAEGLAKLLALEIPDTLVRVSPSAGSVSNLVRVDAGEIDMAIVSAADIVAGSRGELKSYPAKLQNVLAVTRLYEEYGHLAVLANSPIHTIDDLAGARVAVGSLGSGTLSAARRFFKSVGMWDRIKPQYASFDLASDDFLAGRVEAIWQMSGYPSASLVAISEKSPIRLIDLGGPAVLSALFAEHPTYEPGRIPSGVYIGCDEGVATFMDQAVWVASRSVDAEFIRRSLGALYSSEGKAYMIGVHPVAQQLDPEKGQKVADIPFHPGARHFWEEFPNSAGRGSP